MLLSLWLFQTYVINLRINYGIVSNNLGEKLVLDQKAYTIRIYAISMVCTHVRDGHRSGVNGGNDI